MRNLIADDPHPAYGWLNDLDNITPAPKIVRMSETPRLQDVTPPVSASSLEHPWVSILPVDEPKRKLYPFVVGLIVLTSTLSAFVGWMAGAA